MPNLSFTGGKGGDATGGESALDQSLNIAFGGFSVGKGSAGGGSATGGGGIPWLYIGLGAAALALFYLWRKR